MSFQYFVRETSTFKIQKQKLVIVHKRNMGMKQWKNLIKIKFCQVTASHDKTHMKHNTCEDNLQSIKVRRVVLKCAYSYKFQVMPVKIA